MTGESGMSGFAKEERSVLQLDLGPTLDEASQSSLSYRMEDYLLQCSEEQLPPRLCDSRKDLRLETLL